jgi:hypothetical protein
MEQHYSRVYTDRPAYADLDSPEKFQAIQGIIMTRLRQHPKAICSYSGGFVAEGRGRIAVSARTGEWKKNTPNGQGE